jgi:hypothetical protein
MTSKKEGQEQSLCLDYTYFDDGKHRSVERRALSCVKYVVGSMVGSMVGSLVGSMVHLERGLRWRHSMFRIPIPRKDRRDPQLVQYSVPFVNLRRTRPKVMTVQGTSAEASL